MNLYLRATIQLRALLFDRAGRSARIVELLGKIDADVIMLQEVMLSEYNALRKHFGARFHVIRGKNIVWQGAPTHTFNVTVLRAALFAEPALVVDHGFGVECRTMQNARSFCIFNIHLDDLSGPLRTKQIGAVLRAVSDVPNVILGGDFNAKYQPNTKLYKSISAAGFQLTNTLPTYFIGARVCIDNIAVRGTTRPPARVPPADGSASELFAVYGSDHLPVVSVRGPNACPR